MSSDELFLIDSYSREQAIEDGVLVDVSEAARRSGFKYPVALTCGAWAACVVVPDGLGHLQSEFGRLSDILWMLRDAVRSGDSGPELSFAVHVLQSLHCEDGSAYVTLRAVCGPDDDGSPCLTVMLEGED